MDKKKGGGGLQVVWKWQLILMAGFKVHHVSFDLDDRPFHMQTAAQFPQKEH